MALSIAECARLLEGARSSVHAVERLSAAHPELGLDLAYRIQDEGVRMRREAGDAVVGFKMGLTSKAKMKQMGVSVPIMGVLTRDMGLASGARFPVKNLIHPRVEPEVAFILGRDLRGVVGAERALEACSGVCAALEIIDSRFRDFKFTLPDVVADNCSCCAFVLGKPRPPRGLDLGGLAINMFVAGKAVEAGSSADIYGHPAASLAELSSMLAKRGRFIPAGSVVLAGAATAAVPLLAGCEIRAEVEGLGDAVLRAI